MSYLKNRLEGKTAVITGAATGIGRAIAMRFAEEGANVAINFCSCPGEAAAALADVRTARGSAGGGEITVQADISKEDDVRELFAATTAQAPVVPIYVPGSNSLAFHAAEMLHPSLRTAFLARELFNKKRATLELRIGRPIAFEKLAELTSAEDHIQYLRWRTYLLANRNSFKPNTLALRRNKTPQAESIVAAVPPSELAREAFQRVNMPTCCRRWPPRWAYRVPRSHGKPSKEASSNCASYRNAAGRPSTSW